MLTTWQLTKFETENILKLFTLPWLASLWLAQLHLSSTRALWLVVAVWAGLATLQLAGLAVARPRRRLGPGAG